MKNVKTIIFLVMAGMMMQSVNALKLFEFNFENLSNQTSLFNLDFENSTALFDFNLNHSSVGYEYLCKYDNEPSLPACFIVQTGQVGIEESPLGNGIRMGSSDVNDVDLRINPSPNLNFTLFYLFVNNVSVSGSSTHHISDEIQDLEMDLAWNPVTLGNTIFARTDADTNWVSTNLRTTKNQRSYIFLKRDTQPSITTFNNFSQTGYLTYSHSKPQDTVTEYTHYFTFQQAFQAQGDNNAGYLDVVRLINQSPTFNSSANMTQFARQRFSTAQNSYDIDISSEVTNDNLNLKYEISCNNGTNYVSSSQTAGGSTLSTITCFNSQSSHDLILRILSSNNNSNWTSALVYEGGTAPITNTTPVLTINAPLSNSQTHNATPYINWSIVDAEGDNITYGIYLDFQTNPTTLINYSNDSMLKSGNFTFFKWTIINESQGSINSTYYLKINGTDNASNVFTQTISFNLTNNINLYNVTNVSISPSNPSSQQQLRCNYNLTNKASINSIPNQSDNISLYDLHWLSNNSIIKEAGNNSLLNAPNVSLDANISCQVRINNGFGVTAWTEFANTSILTVGDTIFPSLFNASLSKTSYSATENVNITAVCQEANTINFVRVTTNNSNIHTNNTMTRLTGDIFQFASTFAIGNYNIPYLYCQDGSGNTANITTALSFEVTSGGDSGGGGGGGGGGITPAIIIEKNISKIENCNQDLKCDKSIGEDPFSCPTDCKINTNYFTCDNPLQPCVKDTFKNILTARNPVLRISLIIGITSLGILFYPRTLGRRKK